MIHVVMHIGKQSKLRDFLTLSTICTVNVTIISQGSYIYIKKTDIVISKFETRPKAEIFCSLDLREILLKLQDIQL